MGAGDRPGQILIQVMMSVDQAGQQDLASSIDAVIGGGQLLGRRDLRHLAVHDVQALTGQLVGRVVHGHDQAGVQDVQRWHGALSFGFRARPVASPQSECPDSRFSVD